MLRVGVGGDVLSVCGVCMGWSLVVSPGQPARPGLGESRGWLPQGGGGERLGMLPQAEPRTFCGLEDNLYLKANGAFQRLGFRVVSATLVLFLRKWRFQGYGRVFWSAYSQGAAKSSMQLP